LGLTLFVAAAAVSAQQPAPSAEKPPQDTNKAESNKQDSAAQQSANAAKPLKRVRVELKGFELDKTQTAAASSTQIGGGSRGIGGTTTLLAPRIGRTFTAHPTFRWSHSTQAQNFIFQLYDESGAVLFKARVDGVEYHYPENAPGLRPGAMYWWNVRPEVALLGGSSETLRFVRVTENEIKEIADALQPVGTDSKEQLEQRAQILADHRVWFDAVTAYNDLITKNPEAPELHEKRGAIYDQLPGTRALGEEDFAVAEQLRSKSKL
jgi:Domain of Unknown Function (DUF928)